MTPLRLFATLAAEAALVVSVSQPAGAVPMALPSGSIIPGTVWQITYSAPITLQFDPDLKTNNTVGTIIETTIRTTLDPLTIDFLQVFEAPSSASSASGLRLNFEDRVTNSSPRQWLYYELSLIDVVRGPDNLLNTGAHPPPPHFHQTSNIATTAASFAFEGTLAFDGNDLTRYRSSFLGTPAPAGTQVDPSDDLLLGNGSALVELGKNLEVTSLLIHERQFGLCPQPNDLACLPDPARRQFQLVERPFAVPVPGTLLLVLGGFAAVWGFGARSRS